MNTNEIFDFAMAVKEQKPSRQPNWYVAHIIAHAEEEAAAKLSCTYQDQDDAVLLAVKILEKLPVSAD